MSLKIAILGFGLTGRLTALALAKEHQLSVFEQDDQHASNSAGSVAAAMLAPLAESVLCEQDLALQGLNSISRWQQILSELDEPVYFQQAGSLVVAHQQDKGDLQSFVSRLKPLGSNQAKSLSSIQIAELEPELAGRFHQGVYLPCEGQLDNQAFYSASFKKLTSQGVQFKFACKVELNGHQVNGQSFNYVFDCRGLGAKQNEPLLRGVRGEVARLYAPEVNLTRPIRLMHPRYPIYIAPKPNHQFVIGATEIESQDTGKVTVRSALELLSAAYTVHSGFAEGRIESLQSGLRPAFADNRPKVSIQDRVISINGLYRHGYLLAPLVVDEAVSLIA
ncbi:FAD-binding oxidoreductase [Pseudoalteromonas shioyasakiensis]|uniref:FAD-dependent oxidoreductase n=1 Tax=Pseudoalteromonas TaxID=53246 RepID=UPI001430558E|nr:MULTISPECIES: FAD-dependent oxidoreductase [Pseudoalteromonas]MCG9707433.1 FAD-binding oxidoreductase [Pseudoalteromonas sp. Isolate3]MCQ8883068.1 FAD-binding oxidoreductase [Pseudoalteromonas shioyasakiensis]NIZ07269.1 FAD-dependent oxidoreductase [Pseudoalteromonas sp. HF66]